MLMFVGDRCGLVCCSISRRIKQEFSKLFEFLVMAPRVSHFEGSSFSPRSVHYHSFATRVSQLKIWHFWVAGIERNVCRCAFNRYSVITQFTKLAAGEQLCRRCTHRKFYSTSKPLKASPEKSQILSCNTVVANERYYQCLTISCHYFTVPHQPSNCTVTKKTDIEPDVVDIPRSSWGWAQECPKHVEELNYWNKILCIKLEPEFNHYFTCLLWLGVGVEDSVYTVIQKMHRRSLTVTGNGPWSEACSVV